MAAFTWVPDEQPEIQNKPRVLASRLGDGYEQRLRWGLNSQPAVLSLSFTDRRISEIEAIDRFFYDHAGAVAFDYAPQWRQRRNLLTQSETFGGTAWATSGATISADVVAAPNGQITADRLVENTANSAHLVVQNRTGSNETVTFSIYAQAATRSRLLMYFTNGVNSDARAIFNLSTGAIISTTTSGADYSSLSAAVVESLGGFLRLRVTATKAAVNTANNVVLALVDDSNATTYTGNGTSGINLWGAMVNAGSTALEYEAVDVTWSPPIVGKYICDEWRVSPRNCELQTITATLRQVFEP